MNDKTGSNDLLMNGLMGEDTFIEVMAGIPVPPANKRYDLNLFTEKQSLSQFLKYQARDEALTKNWETFLDWIDGGIVESTPIIGDRFSFKSL